MNNNKLIETIENMMDSLISMLEKLTHTSVIKFIKNVELLDKINVKDLETYKEKRIYSSLGHIAEVLCDWVITNEVDKRD